MAALHTRTSSAFWTIRATSLHLLKCTNWLPKPFPRKSGPLHVQTASLREHTPGPLPPEPAGAHSRRERVIGLVHSRLEQRLDDLDLERLGQAQLIVTAHLGETFRRPGQRIAAGCFTWVVG